MCICLICFNLFWIWLLFIACPMKTPIVQQEKIDTPPKTHLMHQTHTVQRFMFLRGGITMKTFQNEPFLPIIINEETITKQTKQNKYVFQFPNTLTHTHTENRQSKWQEHANAGNFDKPSNDDTMWENQWRRKEMEMHVNFPGFRVPIRTRKQFDPFWWNRDSGCWKELRRVSRSTSLNKRGILRRICGENLFFAS